MKLSMAKAFSTFACNLCQLVDTCVKNGGDQFVREIASREFMDQLTLMLRSPVSRN